MVGLSRLLSILYLCICMPIRCITGKTHTLGKYKWGARSMGRVLDILEQKLTEIKGDSSLILNKDYMMGLFANLHDELPPFRKFWEHSFEKRRMKIVSQAGTKVVHLALLRDEPFHPIREDNGNCEGIVKNLADVAVEAF